MIEKEAIVRVTEEQAEKAREILSVSEGRYISEDPGDDDDVLMVFIADFDEGICVDIKVVNGEPPYVDAVLFDHGQEVGVVDPVGDALPGEYIFEYNTIRYIVYVVEEDSPSPQVSQEDKEPGQNTNPPVPEIPRKPYYLDPEVMAAVVAQIRSAKSRTQISKETGFSMYEVDEVLYREMNRLLWGEGVPADKYASRLRVSQATVNRIMRKFYRDFTDLQISPVRAIKGVTPQTLLEIAWRESGMRVRDAAAASGVSTVQFVKAMKFAVPIPRYKASGIARTFGKPLFELFEPQFGCIRYY